MDIQGTDNAIESFPSFARNLTDERKHHRQHKENIQKAKAKLAAEAEALLASVEKALSQLEGENARHSGSYHTSERIQQFTAVKETVSNVLSALHTPGVSLTALRQIESAAKGDFKRDEEAEKVDSAGDTEETKADRRATMITINEDLDEQLRIRRREEAIAVHPWMVTLQDRGMEVDSLINDNTALAAQAALLLAAGSADLQATAALAAVMYDHKNDPEAAKAGIDAFIAGKKEEMLAKGDAAPDARLEAIARNASYIHEGMMQSQEEGAKRLLDIAGQYVNEPLREHMKQSEAHLNAAHSHLQDRDNLKLGKHHKKHLAEFNEYTEKWNEKAQETANRLNVNMTEAKENLAALTLPAAAGGSEIYNSLMKQMKLDEMVDNAHRYAMGNEEIMGQQMTIFRNEQKKNIAAQEKLGHVLSGLPGKDDMDVAYSLGMNPRSLRAEALKFRIDNKAEIEPDLLQAFSRDASNVLQQGRQHSVA